MARKKYDGSRAMVAVCPSCWKLFSACSCGFAEKTSRNAWILVNPQELEYFHKTGLVPNHKAILLVDTGTEVPSIPLVYPPIYDFKI